jgi:hypothetical protein
MKIKQLKTIGTTKNKSAILYQLQKKAYEILDKSYDKKTNMEQFKDLSGSVFSEIWSCEKNKQFELIYIRLDCLNGTFAFFKLSHHLINTQNPNVSEI